MLKEIEPSEIPLLSRGRMGRVKKELQDFAVSDAEAVEIINDGRYKNEKSMYQSYRRAAELVDGVRVRWNKNGKVYAVKCIF